MISSLVVSCLFDTGLFYSLLPPQAAAVDDPLAGYTPFVCGKQRPIECYYPAFCTNRGELNEQCVGRIGNCSSDRCWEAGPYECVGGEFCFEKSRVPLSTPKPVQSCGMVMAVDQSEAQLGISPTLGSEQQAGVQRILNGTPAEPAKWPWMVSLASKTNDSRYLSGCGGSVLSERYVLTAAHCVCDFTSHTNDTQTGCVNETSPDAIYVLSNVSDYTGGAMGAVELRPEWIQRRVEQIYVHPNFVYFPKTPYGCGFNSTCDVPGHSVDDIAMLRLTEPYVYGPWTQPICVSESVVDEDGKEVTIIGYSTDQDHNLSRYGVLREAQTTLLSYENCERNLTFYFANRTRISRRASICMLGFTPPNEKGCSVITANGTCLKYGQPFYGDSGGPLQMRLHDGRWMQLGVFNWMVYFASVPFAQPGTVLPAVYARVSSFCGWMKEVSTGEVQCLPLASG